MLKLICPEEEIGMIIFSFIPITSMLIITIITTSTLYTMCYTTTTIQKKKEEREEERRNIGFLECPIKGMFTLHFFPFFPLIAMIITEKTVGFHAGRKTSLTSMNAMCQLAQFRPDMVREFIKAMIDTINQPAVKTTKGELVLVAPKA